MWLAAQARSTRTTHVRLGSGVGPSARRVRIDHPVQSQYGAGGLKTGKSPGLGLPPLTCMDAARACQLDSVLVFEGPETNTTLSDFPV